MIERLAVLDLKIEALQRLMTSINPPERRPPEWQVALDRLGDARDACAKRMVQLDAFEKP